MNKNLKDLSEAGVSIWLDDLSRERLTSGNLRQLIDEKNVVGVTTNPSIFASALSNGDAYAEQVEELKGTDLDEAIRQLTTTDVRDACDLFSDIYAATDGYDGRVSIEVEPGLARATEATVVQAALLHSMVDRENVLIKIPATKEGLPAIRQTLAAGISVNVTLIFSIQRYREVMDAWLAGLEDAQQAGKDLSKIHSVASFFISRVDVEIDKRLEGIGTDQALKLRGEAGVANARAAYAEWLEMKKGARWEELEQAGAPVQRPLWASTGVKNPDYPDTMYVTELVSSQCVNTMPEDTLEATADHGSVKGDTIRANLAGAIQTLQRLEAVGVDLDGTSEQLENEGVDKFAASWDELVATVQSALG